MNEMMYENYGMDNSIFRWLILFSFGASVGINVARRGKWVSEEGNGCFVS